MNCPNGIEIRLSNYLVIFYFDIHNEKLFAMDEYAIRKEFLCYQNKNQIFGLKPVHKLAQAV